MIAEDEADLVEALDPAAGIACGSAGGSIR